MGFFDDLKKTGIGAVSPALLASGLFKGRKNTQPGNADKDQGMKEFLDAIKDYETKGNNQYSWLGDLTNTPELGSTEMDRITTDPRLKGFEMQALADLEQISKDGLSARDQADLAQLEGQVNRQNAGRTGAIQQSMAARGMGGSGLELVAQMQANQDATERQALASLEKAAMAQEGRRGATAQLGAQAGQMSARDFQQQAQRAAAQDAVNRFNVANQVNTQMYNHQGRQGTANQNVAQNNQFQQNVMGAKQGGAQMQYNKGADANNMAAMKNQQRSAQNAGIGTALGTAGGFMFGGPAGAMAGGAMGGALGGMFYEGGQVPGQAQVPGDHPANDTVPALVSPGEVILPRTVAEQIPGDDPVEAIAKLLGRTKQTYRK
jgi:hypothetical protein